MLWKMKAALESPRNYCSQNFQATSPGESFGGSYERKVLEPSVPWEGLGTLPAHPGITATDRWFSVSLCAKCGVSC